MISLNCAIEEYLEQHTTPMDAVLESLYRKTYLHAMNPRMTSGPVQGRFMQLLCEIANPSRVLEIGTFTGFSTICMARGLSASGRLITIEANEEYEDTILTYLEKAGVADRVQLVIGDAKTIIPSMEGEFDLVFIDADKASYPLYFDLVMERLTPGGLLVADNVLWEGKVLHADARERDTRALREFNQKVQCDPRLENVMLPLRDGLMLARRK